MFFNALYASGMEVIQLRNQTAEELIPIIRPLLGDEGVVTGSGYKLIVRAPAHRIEEIRKLLDEIDIKFNKISNTLWHESPAIAQALGLLNRKISLLAAQGLTDNEQIVDIHPEMTVNMSGCGMAFQCEEALPVDSALRVTVVLKPSNIRLNFTAKVVGCENRSADAKSPYWLRIRIDEENTLAQEQLIQHIVQKQCAQIDAQKSQAGL